MYLLNKRTVLFCVSLMSNEHFAYELRLVTFYFSVKEVASYNNVRTATSTKLFNENCCSHSVTLAKTSRVSFGNHVVKVPKRFAIIYNTLHNFGNLIDIWVKFKAQRDYVCVLNIFTS